MSTRTDFAPIGRFIMPWMRWPTYAFGGTTTLFDADVSSYCDRIPPTKLRTVAAERIADGVVLHLLEYRYLVCASDDDPPEPLFDQFVRLDVIHSTVRVCRPGPCRARPSAQHGTYGARRKNKMRRLCRWTSYWSCSTYSSRSSWRMSNCA